MGLVAFREADRAVALVLGLVFASYVVPLFRMWQDDGSLFVDWLWPWVFLTASVLALAYSARPANRHLCAWSGGVMVGACVARAWAVLSGFVADTDRISSDREWLIFGTWIGYGFAIAMLWVLVFVHRAYDRRDDG